MSQQNNDKDLAFQVGQLLGRMDSLQGTVQSMDKKMDESYEKMTVAAESSRSSHKRIDELVSGLKEYTDKTTKDIETLKNFNTRIIAITSTISIASGVIATFLTQYLPFLEKASQSN